MERLQRERVDLEVRLAAVEDTFAANQRTSEQHIEISHIQEDIQRVEGEAEAQAATVQVRAAHLCEQSITLPSSWENGCLEKSGSPHIPAKFCVINSHLLVDMRHDSWGAGFSKLL